MKRQRYLVLLFVALICAGTPQPALANAGTPMMWATALHLLFGNLLLGIGEGIAVARLLERGIGRAIFLMVLANYFSTCVGGTLLFAISEEWPPQLQSIRSWLAVMVLIAFVLTLLLEWPFIAWCDPRKAGRCSRSLGVCFATQLCSYVLLCGWYLAAGGASILTGPKIVPLDELSLPAGLTLYFISDADGDVYRVALPENRPERVFDLNAPHRKWWLAIMDPQTPDKDCDLVAINDVSDRNDPRGIVVVPKLCRCQWRSFNRFHEYGSWGPTTRLPSTQESPWDFSIGSFPGSELTVLKNDHPVDSLSFGTPFAAWGVANAIQVSDSQVIFQWGFDNICVFDAATRKLSLAARGRGPIALVSGDGPPEYR